jgi:hypothetical protein
MLVNWESEEDVARQFDNERRDSRVLNNNPILQPSRGVSELIVPFVDASSQNRWVRNLQFTVAQSHSLSLCPSVVAELIDQDQPVYNPTLVEAHNEATVLGCAVELAVDLNVIPRF